MEATTGELSEAEAIAQAEMLAGDLGEITLDGLLAGDDDNAGEPTYGGIERSTWPDINRTDSPVDPPAPSDSDILAALLPDSLVIPPAPGTEFSPFRRCACLGAMPGRACQFCSGTRWLKTCLTCGGAGKLTKPTRAGSEPRSERCGFCMGRGTVPANVAEVNAAQTLFDLAMVSVEQGARAKLAENEPGFVRARSAKLPRAEGSTEAKPRSRQGKRKAAQKARSAAARARTARG